MTHLLGRRAFGARASGSSDTSSLMQPQPPENIAAGRPAAAVGDGAAEQNRSIHTYSSAGSRSLWWHHRDSVVISP